MLRIAIETVILLLKEIDPLILYYIIKFFILYCNICLPLLSRFKQNKFSSFLLIKLLILYTKRNVNRTYFKIALTSASCQLRKSTCQKQKLLSSTFLFDVNKIVFVFKAALNLTYIYKYCIFVFLFFMCVCVCLCLKLTLLYQELNDKFNSVEFLVRVLF